MVTYRRIYKCGYRHVRIPTYISLLCCVCGQSQGEMTTSHNKQNLAHRSQFPILFSNEKNQGSSEKWLILGLGQEMHKMSLGIVWS